MAQGSDKTAKNGVVAGSPADLFENFSEYEAGLVADAAPFKKSPMPIGGSRKGKPNKRNVELRELYLKMGMAHPLLAMGAAFTLGIDGLAEKLGCTAAEAVDVWRKIGADILPYIEGKQPTKVIVDGNAGLPVLVFGDAVAALQSVRDARDEGALSIDDDLEGAIGRHEENQRLKDGAHVRSDGEASHDAAKRLNEKDK